MGFISKKGDVVLFGVETDYGVIATTVDRHIGEIESFTPPTYDRKVSVGHQISTTDPSSYKEDTQDYTGGKMEVVFRRGDILEYIVGLSVDGVVGDADDHTLTPTDILGSLSIALARYDSAGALVVREVYLGSVLTSATLACKKGQNVTLSIGFECKQVTSDATVAVATYFTDNPILFKGSTLTLTPAVGSATAVSTITDFVWNFKREISVAKQLNSLLPSHKCSGNWNSDCSFSFYFIDTDELKAFHGGDGSQDSPATEYSLDFVVTNGLTLANERTIQIRGSSSKLGTFSYGDDGGFVTGALTAIIKSMDLVITDATTDWDA